MQASQDRTTDSGAVRALQAVLDTKEGRVWEVDGGKRSLFSRGGGFFDDQ